MNNNDQWFEPGDKVMRVAHDPYKNCPRIQRRGTDLAPYGKVFCVSDFCASDLGNTVKFVGIANSIGSIGFAARNFRKVEEIQLCVRAADAMKKPKKQEEMA